LVLDEEIEEIQAVAALVSLQRKKRVEDGKGKELSASRRGFGTFKTYLGRADFLLSVNN